MIKSLKEEIKEYKAQLDREDSAPPPGPDLSVSESESFFMKTIGDDIKIPDLTGLKLPPKRQKTKKNLHPSYGGHSDYDTADEQSTASDSDSHSSISMSLSATCRSAGFEETCDPDTDATHIHGWLHPHSMLYIILGVFNLDIVRLQCMYNRF